MRTFIINFLISLVIVYNFFQINPEITPLALNSLVALFVAYFILWLLSYFYDRNHFDKLPKVLNLIFYFIKELLIANMRVSWEVITPVFNMQPAVIAYPLESKTDMEITLLANIISLTPGTLTIDISEDKKILYFHTMYVDHNDLEKIKSNIRNGFEKKILAITR